MSGKILRAYIESCKGVTDKKIDFKGKQILALIGDGATGKTSLVEFFKAICTGKIDTDLINLKTGKMAGTADIERDGQVYSVRLHRTKKSETVEVKSPNNMKGGKEVLRSLVGTVAIDPFWLASLDLPDQVKEFKKLIRVDTSELDKQIKTEIGERETLGRIVRQLDGAIKDDPNNRIDMEQHLAKYAEEKPLEDRRQKLDEAIKHNREYAVKHTSVINAEARVETLTLEIDDINRRIADLITQRDRKTIDIEQTRQGIAATQQWLAANPEKDTAQMQKEIDEINEFNMERANLQSFIQKMQQKKRHDEEYAQQKAKVKQLEEQRAELVKSATRVIPDFEFLEKRYDEDGKLIDDREGPYYRGVPISALSHTELVLFGINFKQALDNGLPIIIVDDLESVGSEGIRALETLCQEGKCQAIVSLMDKKTSDLKIVLKNNLSFENADEDIVLDQSENTPQTQNKTNGTPKSDSAVENPTATPDASREALKAFEDDFGDTDTGND
jgi:hypothetical protein